MFLTKTTLLLRLEGLTIFILGIVIYWKFSYGWPLFWMTFLIPDVALFAYLFNRNIGAAAYNVTHAKILPSICAVIGMTYNQHLLLALSIIWFVHIGVDRFLGFGLKYSRGFKFTHLGIIGKN